MERGHLAANDIQIRVGDQDNTGPGLDALKARLTELGKQVANPTIDVNDKDAAYQLALINAKLAETAKKVASPRIDIAGAARASATIAGLELQLHKLGEQKIQVGDGGGQAGRDTGSGFLAGFQKYIDGHKAEFSKSITSALGGGGGKNGGGLAALNAGGVAGGALPGIMGVSGKSATLLGLGGSLLGALPALVAAQGAIGVAGLGTSVIATGAHQLIGSKNTKADPNAQGPLYDQAQQIGKAFQSAMKSAAAGMLGPLKQAFGQIPGLIKELEPALKSVFTGAGSLIGPLLTGISSIAKQVLPELGKAFQAVAPLLAPLLSGLGGLLKGILPALVTLLKAASPAVEVFGHLLAGLGKDVGGMLSSFAPVLKASSVVLGALGTVINAIFPIIGKLAATMAKALAPAFSAFAKAIADVIPALSPLIGVIGEFAGAVVTDLAGVLGAVATLLKDLAPSFTTLAKAMSGVFDVLENSGVFAVLGDALESLAAPLAGLINALVKSLAPALPGLINGISVISAALIKVATVSLSAVVGALTSMVKWLPPTVLQGIAIGLGAIWLAQKGIALYGGLAGAASKLFAGGMALVNLAMDANPIVLVGIALAAIGAAFYVAWQKSALFRDIIKDIGKVMLDVGIFIVEANQKIVMSVLDMIGHILNGMARAFGWVPEVGKGLKAAAKNFDGFKDHVNNGFNSTISTMKQWQRELSNSKTSSAATTNAIVKNFNDQARAASSAKGDLNQYTQAIKTNGTDSAQAQKARQQLITDMTNAGVKAGTAKHDVDAYTTAVITNGADSKQAQAARQKLISDILAVSNNSKRGKADLANYTTAVKDNGAKSDQAKSARAKLMQDLVNAGLDSKTARQLVDNLTTAIKKLPSKKVNVTLDAQGNVVVTGSDGKKYHISAGAYYSPHAAGGIITDGSPYAGNQGDDVLISAKRGEAIVPVNKVGMLAPHLRAAGIPGFASGGMIGFPGAVSNTFDNRVGDAWGAAVAVAAKAAVNAAKAQAAADAAKAAKNSSHVSGAGPVGGDAGANKALARKMFPWPASMWQDYVNLEMSEAGFNRFARNPSSGAYGIPQALPPSKMPFAAQAGGGSHAGPQISWMYNYISGRYGNPVNAWNHEVSNHWYASGGATSAGWASVGEHGRELIKVPGGATVYPNGAANSMLAQCGGGPTLVQLEISGAGQGEFEKFMSGFLKQYIRVKGGGSVQKALGSGSNQ